MGVVYLSGGGRRTSDLLVSVNSFPLAPPHFSPCTDLLQPPPPPPPPDKPTPTSGKAPPSLSQELCDAHCTLLLKLTHKAADRWKDIGRNLGFEEEELDRIVREPARYGDDDYYAAMVRRWLDWAPPRHSCPTVHALADALRAAGKERLANILELKEEELLRTSCKIM